MKWRIGTGVAIALFLSTTTMLYRSWKNERKESQRQATNVEALCFELKEYKVRDSLNASENRALRLKIDELEVLREADAKLIKDLKMRPKEVEYVMQTEVVTKDSLIFVLKDSCFRYADRWAEFEGCLQDSSFHYQVRDSLSHIISRIYKHKFLWWKWGTKGYRMTVINHNPKGKVTYQEVIKIEK